MPSKQSANAYIFSAALWIYRGESTPSSNTEVMRGAWYFITLPKKISAVIRELHRSNRSGWGSVRVSVTIGETSWNTSIFPDRTAGAYLLPVKAAVRRKESIDDGDRIAVEIRTGS